ncbi:multiple inositol polyphosphate phosphatase 1b [Erpetoichthys calabaricus]|uniref:Multiple inositol polyphosphate phosphatase 1 n=1 Tax=Erpetoichthys calabaricus TaxID=27687 RepID=A0A8C4RKT4_ERPCA|nr:multiple inositol polyphosphate phosphatase 1b [Erpetoichthys calabaricus]
MKRQAVFLTIVFARFLSAGNVPKLNFCDASTLAPYFGTKTRYEEVNPHLLVDVRNINSSVLELPYKQCTPVYMNAVIRHGTRYPTAKNIKKMDQIYQLVMNKAQDPGQGWVEKIKKWEMWYNDSMDGQLAEKGKDDLRNLAFRMASAFPTLFTKKAFNGCHLQFITSSKHRCVDSTVAYITGLARDYFEGTAEEEVNCKPEVNDELMRFFEHCRKFVVDIEENKTALMEVDLFKSKPEMMSVLEKMSERLQIPSSDLTPDLVEAAFLMCSYDLAVKNIDSPWCSLFDKDDAKILEYSSDLKQFWKRGYGHEINSKSSCKLFHDIFKHLEQAHNESSRNDPISFPVTVQVGHAETLLPLMSLMGFFKDSTPLTADNFAQQKERLFRTSFIVPYASNLVFILYHCEQSYRVQLLLNEKPLLFPNLDDPAPLYSDVKNLYKDLLEGCDFAQECHLPVKPKIITEEKFGHEL